MSSRAECVYLCQVGEKSTTIWDKVVDINEHKLVNDIHLSLSNVPNRQPDHTDSSGKMDIIVAAVFLGVDSSGITGNYQIDNN